MGFDTETSVPICEIDDVKKHSSSNSCIEEDDEVINDFDDLPKKSSFCRGVFVFIMIILIGWLVGSSLIAICGIAYDGNDVTVLIEATQVKFGDEQVIISEIMAEEIQVFVVNMTDGAEIPDSISPSFYSCMHTLSPEVVGCVSQFYVPTFDECLALSKEESLTNDLSEPRSISTCGLVSLSNGEYTLCSNSHPVYISIWNLEEKSRTIELTYSYDECQLCNEVEGNCNVAEYYWQSVFLMYSIALFACCCCIGCVCGCAASPSEEEEEEYEEDIEQSVSFSGELEVN